MELYFVQHRAAKTSCSTTGGQVLLSARFGAVAMREIGSKL